MHSILNRVIQAINPATIEHEPHALFSTFKDSLRDGAIGKLLILNFVYLFKKKSSQNNLYLCMVLRNKNPAAIPKVTISNAVRIHQIYK